jgi:hypothetical protein
MRVQNSTRYAAIAALLGGLACAGNKARTDDTTQPDQAAAARDTTSTRDTLNGQNENPPGYRGMERDTSIAPPTQQTPTDTFLQRQGQGAPQDTTGYSGAERADTTGYTPDSTRAAGVSDTSGTARAADSSWAKPKQGGLDSTGMSRTGDTTGYNRSQQPRDSSGR